MNNDKLFRILLIDDDPDSCFLVRCILENLCQVDEAHNSEQGIASAVATSPDLILLDVNMPGQDGFATCRQLHDDPQTSHIPVIFLTSSTATDDMVEGFAAGGIDYITKPFESTEMRARVKAQLRLQRANAERSLRMGYLSSALTGLEQNYLFYADNTADVLVRCGPDRIIRHVNRQWSVLTGLEAGSMIGRPMEELAAEADRDLLVASLDEAIQEQRDMLRMEFNVPAPGSCCPVRASFLFRRGSGADCIEINGVLSDISDLVQSGSQGCESPNADMAASHIAYLEDVSHEIRTPLNGIVGAAEALEQMDLPAEARDMVQIISSSSIRLEHLLASMLESRPGGGEAPCSAAERKVLLVDDSNANIRVLIYALHGLGFTDIEYAVSGQEAWEKWQAGQHDLLLLDYRMDGMSGYDLCRLIRSHAAGSTAIVIGISAHALPENADQARAAGFNSQIAKPISRMKLRNALESHGVTGMPH